MLAYGTLTEHATSVEEVADLDAWLVGDEMPSVRKARLEETRRRASSAADLMLAAKLPWR